VYNYTPACHEDGTECFEPPAYKIQVRGNYPEENLQHKEHGESLKSRIRVQMFGDICCLHLQAKRISSVGRN
jgi:hypothetical protein